MSGFIRRFAERFPQTAALAKLSSRIMRFHIERMRDRSMADWSEHIAGPTAGAQINDIPLAFAKSVVLQRGYQTLIEIGTYNGERVIELKRQFPSIDVYGLDIQDRFDTPYECRGVRFRAYDLEFISQPHPRCAILSFGVMVCMTREQLSEFLVAARAGKADIVFRELTPVFRHTRSLHRNARTWYHDFDEMFTTHGYRMLGPRDTGQVGQFDMNFFELGYFNVAQVINS